MEAKHILIAFKGSPAANPEKPELTEEQAKAKAEALHKQIVGGAAFDVQAVCTGFIYALATADRFIASGAHKCALVVGAEVFSRLLDWNDRRTCVLFGDGAGAIVLPRNAVAELACANPDAFALLALLLLAPDVLERILFQGRARRQFGTNATRGVGDRVIRGHVFSFPTMQKLQEERSMSKLGRASVPVAANAFQE